MKIHPKYAAAFAALLMISGCPPTLNVKADSLSAETVITQDYTLMPVETPSPEATDITGEASPSPDRMSLTEQEAVSTPTKIPLPESDAQPDETAASTPEQTQLPEMPDITEDESSSVSTAPFPQGINAMAGEASPSPSINSLLPNIPDIAEKKADAPVVPDKAPAFSAAIEYSPQGYIVKGSFTEFPPDTCFVCPLYSLDGEAYHPCVREWNLHWLGAEDEDSLSQLHNQTCLNDSHEPLKSYLSGELDRFYIKLRITRGNGITYETQAAVIERPAQQPVPEEILPFACFASSLIVRERNPYRYYGKYQLTISADTTPEDIFALLPDTLPVEVQFQGKNYTEFATGIIDCPVTWKALSLPSLAAGQSVTVYDAAEEIVVPAGTLVNTPMGGFLLDEPLRLDVSPSTDEVRLVLNVVPKNENPTGALCAENAGLKMTFDLKPTGATSIRAYTLSSDAPEWMELPSLPLWEMEQAQLSTPNSCYTLVLPNTQEPYRSYLEAEAAGNQPVPFFVGLKIEGGVYDGRQLVLPWPASYKLPSNLPEVGGSGGNWNNAGSNNKNDSTMDGQRPNLPQNTDGKSKTTTPDTSSGIAPKPENEHAQDSPAPSAQPAVTPSPQPAATPSMQPAFAPSPQPVIADRTAPDMQDPKKDTAIVPVTAHTDAQSKMTLPESLPWETAMHSASELTEEKAKISPNTGSDHANAILPAAAVLVICVIAACKMIPAIFSGKVSGKILNLLRRIFSAK